MKRRNFIASALAGGMLAGITPGLVFASGKDKKKLRVAHITDMHIKPEPIPQQGIEKLLQSLDSLDEKPDLVINTGDNVWDSLQHSKEETLKQWDSWNEYFRSKLKYPLYNCLGNHDIWGWNLKEPEVKNDPEYGKVLGMKMLGLEKSYYSFDEGNWHFIMLDSLTYKDGGGYFGKLGDEQMSWLENDLQQVSQDKPICLSSHIPILSPSAFFSGKKDDQNWQVSVSVMHDDAKEIKNLFYKYPNVKVALSGHLHLCDQASYLNVGYACNGAVSGGWWRGNNQEFGPAYALIDFFDDGTFNCRLVFL